ncbi:OmpA-OmpF porin, OOP family [Salinihabitans flavidus]|uniref:OmpA-OmpF porin, OOP family n=1 Tax=Salinihabitans flavidus TaxID=569882 RepID=A0A1H8UTM4_9RHOB|nr:OmpA family protein [Salinihabitans flavidus]SEP06542.1 OmpA-OmpF porin, OOP family [Salinihabitans flavidus]
MIRRFVIAAALFWPEIATALPLDLPPRARLAHEEIDESGGYALPLGPADETGAVPSRSVEGQTSRQVWRVEQGTVSTRQIMAALREQIVAAGWEVLLDCQTEGCGGFDFRFATEVVAPPRMFVDLADFRFLSASRPDGPGIEALSLLVSRTGGEALIQVIHVDPTSVNSRNEAGSGAAAVPDDSQKPPVTGSQTPGALSLAEALIDRGHVVLGDLVFETGASALGGGTFDSLDALATFLNENPGYRVALVGHTDTLGGLDNNLALSRRRAEAVLNRLVDLYGIPAARIEAHGIAWLAPAATNLTEAGKNANRRVEAVLLPDG